MVVSQDVSQIIESIYGSLGYWKSVLLKMLQFQAISDSKDEFWTSSNPLGEWSVDRHPLFVVKAQTEQDISNAVRCALLSRLRAVPGTIRQNADMFGLGADNNSVVIDLTQMTGISELDTVKQTATIRPGTLIREVQDELVEKNEMWAATGLMPSLGVADSVLGGGRNLWSNLVGAASDQLLSAKMVAYDGSVLEASYNVNPELLWALRGGGEGNFGIVSEMTIALHKKPERVYIMRYVWGTRHISRLFCHFSSVMDTQRRNMLSLDSNEADFWRRRIIRLGVTKQNLTAIIAIYNPPDEWGSDAVDLDRRITSLALESVPPPEMLEKYFSSNISLTNSVLAFQKDWDRLLSKDQLSGEMPALAKVKEKNVLVSEKTKVSNVYCNLFARQMWKSDDSVDRCEIDFYGGAINELPTTATSFVHRKTGININFKSIINSPYYSLALRQGKKLWSVNSWTHFQAIALHEAYRSPLDPDLNVSVDWAHLYYAENLHNLLLIREYYDPFRLFDMPQGLSKLKLVIDPLHN